MSTNKRPARRSPRKHSSSRDSLYIQGSSSDDSESNGPTGTVDSDPEYDRAQAASFRSSNEGAVESMDASEVEVVPESLALAESSRRISRSARLSVWDDDMVHSEETTKIVNGVQKIVKRMTCLWCDKTWNQKNATKMTCHLAKISGQDAAPCTASFYPKDSSGDVDTSAAGEEHRTARALKYRNLYEQLQSSRKRKVAVNEIAAEAVAGHQHNLVRSLSANPSSTGVQRRERSSDRSGRSLSSMECSYTTPVDAVLAWSEFRTSSGIPAEFRGIRNSDS